MLNPDLQHQFWVTKKAVQRKLGSKEDECIVASDAELDSKIDLLKSISDSSSHLKRVIDSYQEKICILAQEENATGIFLKESGKHSATSSRAMCCAGKSISYCGQQHMKIRPSLVRLQHEMDTFVGRAIKDTHTTVQAMERERTEYRAALGWMKAASAQLDPDKGRGLDKFRNAQMYVRTAKTKFDTMTLDCLQKIDLLAAARCNMFSHVLVAYYASLLEFATKTSYTFQAALKILEERPQYNFTILKDLTQVPIVRDETNKKDNNETKEITPIDCDQMLFFKKDFEDDTENTKDMPTSLVKSNEENKLPAIVAPTTLSTLDLNVKHELAIESTVTATANNNETANNLNILDLFDLSMNESNENDCLLDMFNNEKSSKDTNALSSSLSNSLAFDILQKIQGTSNHSDGSSKKLASSKQKITDKNTSAWLDLFADLDPLANPTNMEKKISGSNQNWLDA